jgi:hypothetical protein
MVFEQMFEHAGGGDLDPRPRRHSGHEAVREVVVAMRRYADEVEVRKGWVPDAGTEGPEQFLWHGRLWKVRAVLAHWVETGAWWGRRSDEGVAAIGDLLTERELWRVEAGRGMPGLKGEDADVSGVFELSFDWSDGRWQLVGCTD